VRMRGAAIVRFLLCFILCLISGGCGRRQPESRASASEATYKVLATFPADPASTLQYQLVILSCRSNRCPVAIRLVSGDRLLDLAILSWDGTTQDATAEAVDAQWGAGDPLGAAPQLKAWATGEEANYLSTVARTARVTPKQMGLLVTQRAGWEHLRHRHDLFMNDGAKIHREWSAEEGTGPTWSSSDTISNPDKTDQILHYSAFQQPAPDKPDDLGVSRVSWDLQQQKIVETPLVSGDPIRLVAFGEYPSIARAFKAREKAASCVPPFLWVLDGRYYGGGAGKFFLGTITAHGNLARRILEVGKQCSPPLKGSIALY
jgi:hypothetical protein